MDDLLFEILKYFPIVAAAYLAFVLIRFPDLSIESTWALSGIVAAKLMSVSSGGVIYFSISLAVAILVGLLCGLTVATIFRSTGRQKLLSSLIAYFIIVSVGFRVLGDDASIFFPEKANFGLPPDSSISVWFWISIVVVALFFLKNWEDSKVGLRTIIVGETNGEAAPVFSFNVDRYYTFGICTVAILAALGGSLFSLYYGQASNSQGVSILIKGIFGAFAGERIVSFIPLVRRSLLSCAIFGSVALGIVLVLAEILAQSFQDDSSAMSNVFDPNDKSLLVGMLLLVILAFRPKDETRNLKISDW